jgi:sulfotransferase
MAVAHAEGIMVSNLHLISGLPRSGSTLLCALLRQNPRFSAAMTSPVALLCGVMHPRMTGGEFAVLFDDTRRLAMLRGIFDAYYSDISPEKIIFDTNRSWTGKMALLNQLYPKARIVCCVREVGWILDSVERMLNKNPLELSRIFNFQPGVSVYSRAETLMNSETGLIGQAWSTLREAWFGDLAKRLIVVPYNTLVQEPKRTMQRLYEELGEKPFVHDFQNVIYDAPDYDAHLGMPGLHKVREKVEYQERKSCIPPDLFAKYANTSFWEKSELNVRGVKII